MAIWKALGPSSNLSKYGGKYRWTGAPLVPMILPRKYFSHFDKVPDHQKEGTCISCYHFLAEVELEEDMPVDIRTRLTRPGDDASYRNSAPVVWGYCLFFYPLIAGKLHCQDTCPYHDRKPDPLQYEDDAMTDFNEETGVEPFRGTVLPR